MLRAVSTGADDVRDRAAQGAALLGTRSAIVYAFGIAANLALARLLTPRDFGIVALGTVLLVAGAFVAEAGFGAALIRRKEPPERIELAAVAGLQLAFTVTIVVACAAAALPLGRDAAVVATMAAALPIRVVRAPATILLERRLEYRLIAVADVVEALTFYVWALVGVGLGFGVWGIATAAMARAVAGSAILVAGGPLGFVAPRWSWRHVRPLVGFGARTQGASALLVLREQGVAVALAAAGGLTVLGVWNLAWRVLQVPNVLLNAAGRVGFPLMSRLRDADEDPRPVLERGAAALAVCTGAVVVAIVGAAPALPAVVGNDWQDVSPTLLWSGMALLVSAPVAVATTGFLLASDEAGSVAATTVLSAVAWIGIGVALLPEHGVAGVGVGFLAGGIVNAALLAARTASLTGARTLRHAAAPTVVALAAAAAGWLVAREAGSALGGGAAGVAAGEAILLAGLVLAARPALRDARALVLRALGRRGRP